MTDYSDNEPGLTGESSPVPKPAAAVPEVTQPTLMERFLMGNYFYVFSAVAFMLGCYLLMTAPFITGTIFMRTLKSFLVLQGYEFLLLGSAALITFKLGRGGDVITLFLIGLVLLLDPTFFANAFYTIRQDINPIYPPLVCGISLLVAIVKFEVFRRLLRLQVSGRYMLGFLVAACMVWLSGLMLTHDIPRTDATTYSYLLAWVPLLATAIIGDPNYAVNVPDEKVQSPRWFSFLVVAILPVLCGFHQVELNSVFDVPYHVYLMAPFFLAIAFALVRAARPGNDDGPLYASADVFMGFALIVSLSAGRSGPIVGALQMPSPLYLMLAGIGILYGYGFLKHHSKVARYHLLAYVSVAALTALTLLLVKYVLPVLREIQLPTIPEEIFSSRSFIAITTLVMSWFAWKKKTAILWLMTAFCAIVFVFGFIPGGYTVWLAEMLQLCFISLFVYFYFYGRDIDKLTKMAVIIVALALIRYVLFPHAVATVMLVALSISMILLSWHLRDSTFAILAAVGFAVLGFSGIKYVITSVHPSVIALAVGAALFGVGLWVTFQKSKLLAAVAQSKEKTETAAVAPERVANGVQDSTPDAGDDLGTGER